MENEVLFESSYQQDPATMRTVYRGIVRTRRRIMIPLFSVVLGLSVAANLINPQGIGFLFQIGLMLFFLLYAIFMPHLYAWSWSKQHRKIVGEESGPAIIRFSDKEIEGVEQRNIQYFQYAQITRVRIVGRMWLLMIGRLIAIPVPMDSFTQGRAADFPAFIASKCPGIKGFK